MSQEDKGLQSVLGSRKVYDMGPMVAIAGPGNGITRKHQSTATTKSRHTRLLVALLYGMPMAKAAQVARLSAERAAQVSREPEFRTRMREAQERMVDQTGRLVLRRADKIIDRLLGIVTSPESCNSDVISAARTLLDRMLVICPPTSEREAREQSRPLNITADTVAVDLSSLDLPTLRRLTEQAVAEQRQVRIVDAAAAPAELPAPDPDAVPAHVLHQAARLADCHSVGLARAMATLADAPDPSSHVLPSLGSDGD